MKTKTALIARDNAGTADCPRWKVGMYYRGNYLTWLQEGGGWSLPVILTPYPLSQTPLSAETLAKWKAAAKAQGFTHIKIAGDWSGVDKPRGGRL